MSDNNIYASGVYTKEAAEEEQRILMKQGASHMFCPLTKTQCNDNCVCIVKPHVHQRGLVCNYKVADWGCNNPMLIPQECLI